MKEEGEVSVDITAVVVVDFNDNDDLLTATGFSVYFLCPTLSKHLLNTTLLFSMFYTKQTIR